MSKRTIPYPVLSLLCVLLLLIGRSAAEEATRYPWPHLDQLTVEFEALMKQSGPEVARLAEVRASFPAAKNKKELVSDHTAVRGRLTDLLQEGEDVIERYRSTLKFIQMTALTKGMRISFAGKKVKEAKKSALSNRATEVLVKIMKYEGNFSKMKREQAGLYGIVSADESMFALMQAQAAKEASARMLRAVVVGVVAITVGVSIWIIRGKKEYPTLVAVPYEEVPKITGAPALPGPVPVPGARSAQMPETLGKNFQILKEIGRGGMGVVYAAMDLSLRRRVAIKRMRVEVAQSSKELEQFLSEARLVASLKHPCLVEIYSILKEDAEIYLVFEYVEGWTLQQLLDKKTRLPLKEANFILRQIAGALDYAHSQKVIHRDLKPSNVMITPQGVVKVMDFGIAYQAKMTAARLTQADIWGTPPYMAPEQELGSISKESDIFSLGVCYYEMLTGKLPFRGPNFLAQKRERHFSPPSETVAELGPDFDALVGRSLAPDVKERFHSGQEFVAAVAALATKPS